MTKKLLTLVLGVALAATLVVMRPAAACLPGGTCNITDVVIRAINWEPPDYGELFHFEGKADGVKYTSLGPSVVTGWFDANVTMERVDATVVPPELPPSPVATDSDPLGDGDLQVGGEIAAVGEGSLTVNTGTGTFGGSLTVALAADGAGVWVVTGKAGNAIGSGVVAPGQFTGSMSSAAASL